MFALFDQIIPGPGKIAVIGSGCSVATEPTAEVSHFYNITQVRLCQWVQSGTIMILPSANCHLQVFHCLPRYITITIPLPFSPHFSLPPSSMQISCASASTELANRVRFRYYFQMLASDADVVPTYFGVIQQYGWRKVGLIVQNENLFTVVRRNTLHS